MLEKTALIIFAREPKDGKTKTRLLKDLDVKTVTQLYKTFLRKTFAIAKGTPNTEHFIYYAGTGSSIPFLRKYKNSFILRRQIGDNLGIRMHHAFTYCSKQKFNKIILIGTDCLTLTTQDIQKAFDKLNRYDCVLGPAKDGGYYLIGLNHPQKKLFENIPWSTDSVLMQTIKQLQSLKKTYSLLRKQEDIDTIESLKRYKAYEKRIQKK
ncbi:hypothetical protein MNBD_UNCLBAC01-900 [hydrothermal vent metagenome]|uniref:Glycosyltransferase n=1 Tax=hydrothermal vent metagenome TaxID=652676 RepID=A0A3B1DQR3_9ZZZZ